MRNYFGKLGTPGADQECKDVVKSVFLKLDGLQKYCKILLDEIYIKPAIRYSCQHIIGFSMDQPDQPATTVLAILIAPVMGAPAFVARLLPMCSLEGVFLFEQVSIIIKLIHESTGYVFLVMSDNLRTYQNCFSLMRRAHGSVNDFAIKHPIQNDVFEMLYLLYDPTHLFKKYSQQLDQRKNKNIDISRPR